MSRIDGDGIDANVAPSGAYIHACALSLSAVSNLVQHHFALWLRPTRTEIEGRLALKRMYDILVLLYVRREYRNFRLSLCVRYK